MKTSRQPWLGNPLLESIFILGPAFFPVALVYIFRDYFLDHDVSTLWWVILVVFIDVSHVYSTLFRLYWDRQTFENYKRTLVIIPVVAFIFGFCLHLYDALIFWRILAYVAVFHFVRQQYGFMRLYSRKDTPNKLSRTINTVSIYNATLYPLLYWHIHATDKLAWFVEGDFVRLDANSIEPVTTFFYFFILVVYLVNESLHAIRNKSFNIPKNLIVVGTYVSWYVGIVAFQGDLIFTLVNVVAHGIPYMALIWIHGEKKTQANFAFNLKGLSIFVGILVALAYLEESLWDGMVWKDHPEVFPVFSNILPFQHPAFASVVVSILVLPQVTHYILDGFIWRFSKDVQSRLE